MLLVRSYCAYLTAKVEKMRGGDDGDFAALTYVKLVKDDRDKLKPNSFVWRPNVGAPYKTRFSNTGVGVKAARKHFGQWAAAILADWEIDRPALIPLPNSNATVDFDGEYPTLQIAVAIAEAFGIRAAVYPGLRWKQAKTPAHKGGVRDIGLYRSWLAYDGTPIRGTAILVDDLLSFGTTMKAAREVLKRYAVVTERGIVCGRRATFQAADPFDMPEEDLDDPGFDAFDLS